jgi:hypothetical protein
VDKQKQQQEELRTSNAATGHVMSDSSSSPVEPLPASKAKPKAAPKAKAAPKKAKGKSSKKKKASSSSLKSEPGSGSVWQRNLLSFVKLIF